ncbi:MAG: hypothetical protein KF761_01160 [Salinibacterium sp.]|nr:hypothetical protein [Salinibacterium sp.]
MKNASVLIRALVYGAIVTVAVALIGSIIGYLVDGVAGLLSALLGAGVTALFMGFTTLSVLVADRANAKSPSGARYFAIILGMWLFKFVVFIVILLAARGQQWMSPYVFFVAVIVAVIGSLVVDMVALKGARVPYVGDIALPGAPDTNREPKAGRE